VAPYALFVLLGTSQGWWVVTWLAVICLIADWLVNTDDDDHLSPA
jgi:hypothetical protein